MQSYSQFGQDLYAFEKTSNKKQCNDRNFILIWLYVR